MKCKKDLFLIKYNNFAFKQGKKYEKVFEDDEILTMKDEKGNDFTFSKTVGEYCHKDYFLIPVARRAILGRMISKSEIYLR